MISVMIRCPLQYLLTSRSQIWKKKSYLAIHFLSHVQILKTVSKWLICKFYHPLVQDTPCFLFPNCYVSSYLLICLLTVGLFFKSFKFEIILN